MLAVSAHNVQRTFDDGKVIALKDVTVDILSGEFVAIIGLSGAGKSTFLRVLNGMQPVSHGDLTVLNRPLAHLSKKGLVDLRKDIGFIFQQFNLVKNLTALQNVLVGRVAFTSRWRALSGWFSAEDRKRAVAALDSVGLVGRYHEIARNLSGGQQQRVAIARALVQQPQMILADEPMASLDPKLSEVVLDILAKCNREQKITVLVNIHVLELATKYASRIIAFRKGEIVYDGSPSGLTKEKLNAIYEY